MKANKALAFVLMGVMTASMVAGCGSINGEATVASCEDATISLGVANFAAKYSQSGLDSMASYFGDDMWSQDLYGSGNTLEEDYKADTLESLEALALIQAHMSDYGYEVSADEEAAIDAAVSEFISSNASKSLKVMGADEKYVKEYLTLRTIQKGVHDIIVDQAEVEVTDEEAKQQTISYVTIDMTSATDDNGETIELTDEDKAAFRETASSIADCSRDTFVTMVEQLGFTTSSYTYGSDDSYSTVPEAVITAANELTEGQVSSVIEDGDKLYVFVKESDFDEEATETKKAELIDDKKEAAYQDVVNGFWDQVEWTVNEKEWSKVNFKYMYTAPSEESAE